MSSSGHPQGGLFSANPPRLAETGNPNMTELLSPLEWVFVILLGLVPLVGLAFHLWVMLAGHGKPNPDDAD
ncbi:hypothetical protein GKE73_07595 [Paludibacterium sp. dN 18-1]|uniref:Uncharacterized protein n=1 Tax=Paludibacterium denitrificans TaxID=2675226 RepID=A0A844G9I5_9NEIS|nr:hypothetical protein [Paludibacterium denitrificans]